jgi:hypothetical protein
VIGAAAVSADAATDGDTVADGPVADGTALPKPPAGVVKGGGVSEARLAASTRASSASDVVVALATGVAVAGVSARGDGIAPGASAAPARPASIDAESAIERPGSWLPLPSRAFAYPALASPEATDPAIDPSPTVAEGPSPEGSA